STSIKNQDLSGLKSFSCSYPEAKRILLYRGAETQVVDSILCMPCEAFLRGLHPNENIME
ncbi:MAG: ATP-binding protein, partial [bacterium]